MNEILLYKIMGNCLHVHVFLNASNSKKFQTFDLLIMVYVADTKCYLFRLQFSNTCG